MKNLLSGGSGLSEQYCMMSGSKAPDLDAYGLFRAAHSHNPAPIVAYRGIIIPLLCSYRGRVKRSFTHL